MADIYRSAASVTSWLGSGNSTIPAFLDVVDDIWQHRQHIALNRQRGRLPVVELGLKMFLQEIEFDKFVRGLDDFCNSEYWTRLWIVPEYILQEIVYIAYGSRKIDSRGVLDVIVLLRDYVNTGQQPFYDIVKHSNYNSFINQIHKGALSRNSLANVVCFYGFNKCLDLRDRITLRSVSNPIVANCDHLLVKDSQRSTAVLSSHVDELPAG